MSSDNTKKEEPINGENDLTNPEENSSVDLAIANLTFNIFFDGTWNSKENSDLYNEIAPKQVKNLKDRMDAKYNPQPWPVGSSLSFARAPSVVDQLHRAADSDRPHVINLYTDGSGIETRTESNDASAPVPGWEYHADDGIGSGLGMGDTGAKTKLENMLEHVKTALASYVGKGNNPKQLVFNVYGFSRGSATARMFCKRIFTERSTPKVKEFVDLTKYDVVFDFVGLFDTVSSIGTNHDNDVEDDGQELDFKEIDGTKVVHIVAGDEYRQKFNLTSIGQSVRADVGLEFIIPGCHTDIGDGLSTLGEVNKVNSWYIKGRDDAEQVVLSRDRHKLPQFGSPRERRREPARYRDIEPDPNRDIEMSSFWKVFTPKVFEYQSQSFSAQKYADFDIILQSLKAEGWADNTGKAEYQCLGKTCEIDTCKVKRKQVEHEAAGLIPVAEPEKATGKEAELFIRCTGDKNQLITNRKQVSPDYPKIPTHLMLTFIKKYCADFYLPDTLKMYAVPAGLSSAFKELKSQALALDGKKDYVDKNMHKADGNPHRLHFSDLTIKNRYLHVSSSISGPVYVSVPNIDNRENIFFRYVIQG
ncbi:phospholipase effector Tle1 domain-containing protein [Psychrobacter fozii]|uniref:Putative alpha/beta hydrolase family protein DUF2235 n=1 Tax=Psychrobacter fozii TaxID=198480 RepID=A0A2V4VN31_9GAMM|nr:DUF2235 domain-containing protein [Psychrobacter fozii]PYE40315.1 putative alpha/beta hydrolase family protein DUF2235 [Psychrobacter fozii]